MKRIHAICTDAQSYTDATAALGKGFCFGVACSVSPVAAELVDELHLFLDVEDDDSGALWHELANEHGFTTAIMDVTPGELKISTLEQASFAVASLEVAASKGTAISVDTGVGVVELEAAEVTAETAPAAELVVEQDRTWWQKVKGFFGVQS